MFLHFASRSLLPLLLLSAVGVAAPVAVTIDAVAGLQREGKPYFIKGAGGETRLAELAARGGNSLRTWGPDELGKILPQAQKLRLTVSAGIWLESECNWFSYRNSEHCAKQRERVRGVIRQYKDHPALLAWGLGNEMEGDGKNAALWQQLNKLVEIVHQEDPAHPAFTALAGMTAEKAAGLNEYTTKLDFVGINTYGGIFSLRETLPKQGWTRPYVVTEYGPLGFWEVGKTAWGASKEQTSDQKSEMIRKAYGEAIAPGGRCFGGYAFLWGQKQEASSTWFGTFTADGESTSVVDALQVAWTGKPPANHAPALTSLTSPAAHQTITPNTVIKAEVKATDPEGDPLTYRWQLCRDEAKRDPQGRELPVEPIFTQSTSLPQHEFTAPSQPGKYRFLVFALDGKGHAGTANFPFLVK